MDRNQLLNLMKSMSGNNQIMNNALKMIESGDLNGIEQLARNLCKSKGIDADTAFNNIKQQYGIR